ncbi:hypothetical protein [Nitrosomonas oligotropha]|uniref:hypothetical protein n=1 Tax=Nitrosomonas oligotropha TaxID=42354 RepID=UPI00136EFED3|nr:hypothetical protein [Nitrosomonas oligotropha]MXS83282.1 hypothetical protein [Nitrosomonas oligotropha]
MSASKRQTRQKLPRLKIFTTWYLPGIREAEVNVSMIVGFFVAQVRDGQNRSRIFTNLEHFSAGILKIGGSISRDSIADPTDPEIIAEV